MESQNFKQSQHVIFLDTANNEPIKVWIADLSYRTFDHIESKVIQSAQDIERLTNALDEFEFSAPLVDQAQTFSASFGIQVELCLSSLISSFLLTNTFLCHHRDLFKALIASKRSFAIEYSSVIGFRFYTIVSKAI